MSSKAIEGEIVDGEKAFAVEFQFTSSTETGELAAALAKAQGAMMPAVKSAKNPFYKSNYADLGSVMDVIRKPFSDNGIAIVQGPFSSDYAKIVVRTRLMHSSGQWIESSLKAEAKDMGPQAVGSVITYLRRYALSAMAGVATEDDDGNAAEAKEGEAGPTQSRSRPTEVPRPSEAQKAQAAPTSKLSSANYTEVWSRAKAQAKVTGATDKIIINDVLAYLKLPRLDDAGQDYPRLLRLIDGWEPGVDFASMEKD